jgi:hypothetical protein
VVHFCGHVCAGQFRATDEQAGRQKGQDDRDGLSVPVQRVDHDQATSLIGDAVIGRSTQHGRDLIDRRSPLLDPIDSCLNTVANIRALEQTERVLAICCEVVEQEGDEVADLHLWRLGPVHLGAIPSVVTAKASDAGYYRSRLAQFHSVSHLTIEVSHPS